ncbi:pyridoxal phosphate-dependent transferase [Boeremia exigua]|uniref:pyridoxal phosphate-dependent transferase n=1 Tax=Boeremia exigua TaxID=749465 RepID=UPI001E8EE4D1|nr:pyridoxal phosphate-dependent transferase [Boeremia exigua]KAH6625533.1 pyridoxal phosphate-dependent transferase [Boeremia exigua]
METLRQAGVFWFNNGILAPDEEPGNWPFHLKEFERQAVRAKAERIGSSMDQTRGYVCSVSEAHAFCIRAARQDILRAAPHAPVTLITGASAHPGVDNAAELLGIPLRHVQCGRLGAMIISELEAALDTIRGAVIVVATWRNTLGGGFDDVQAISQRLSARTQRNGLPSLIHLDAVRCFDDVSTLGEAQRTSLGLPRLVLGGPPGQEQSAYVGVATLAAGGVSIGGMGNEQTVALVPRELGGSGGTFIECVAGRDDTIAGSRDVVGGALLALHDARFDAAGLQLVYSQCRLLRDALVAALGAAGVPVLADARGLDLVVEAGPWATSALFDRWGARRLPDGAAMLAVQPAWTQASVTQLLADFNIVEPLVVPGLEEPRLTAVPAGMVARLMQVTGSWRTASARSCGYPGDHSTLSVLGPIVGHAVTAPFVASAATWTASREQELLAETCAALGVEAGWAAAAFTSGSTASNRIGILTALRQLPHATVYASAAAHYSITKIAADHERLRSVAIVNVPTDALGRMVPAQFARCVAQGQRTAAAEGRAFAVLLLVSAGTTFSGATDDIPALCAAAARVRCCVDYIHLDGALNLGASMDRITLGPPGAPPIDPFSGRHVVQGISVSQHKFPGLSVAGQVVCWSPQGGRLAAHDGQVDRRAIFEMWLYRQLTSPADRRALYLHCLANARRLRLRLQHAGIQTLFNPDSVITLVERQPPWLIDRFNLAPEGNWVHFIAMPHVASFVVDEFVDAVADHASAVRRALVPVHRHVARLFARPFSDVFLKPLSSLNDKLLASIATALYSSRISSSARQVEELRLEWINSTLCFAATDSSNSLLAALLCRISCDRAIESCAALIRDSDSVPEDMQSTANILVGSLFALGVVHRQSVPKISVTRIRLSETTTAGVNAGAGAATAFAVNPKFNALSQCLYSDDKHVMSSMVVAFCLAFLQPASAAPATLPPSTGTRQLQKRLETGSTIAIGICVPSVALVLGLGIGIMWFYPEQRRKLRAENARRELELANRANRQHGHIQGVEHETLPAYKEHDEEDHELENVTRGSTPAAPPAPPAPAVAAPA